MLNGFSGALEFVVGRTMKVLSVALLQIGSSFPLIRLDVWAQRIGGLLFLDVSLVTSEFWFGSATDAVH